MMADSYDTGGILTSEPFDGSSQSTVSVDLEPELTPSEQRVQSDDEVITDVDSTREIEPVPIHKGGRVAISDLFKRLKPTVVKSKEPADDLADQPLVEIIPSDDTLPDSPPPFHKQIRSGITAKDLLTGFQRQKKATEAISAQSLENTNEPPVESKVEPKKKSGITARDVLVMRPPEVVELLSSEEEEVKPTRTRRKAKNKQHQQQKSLFITLHYKPQHKKIAELEQKIKMSSTRTISAKDLLRSFGKKIEESKPEEPQILEINSAPSSPETFITKGIRNPGGKSFLDVLSDTQRSVKNPISKLKELYPPELTPEQLHVTYPTDELTHRTITLPPKTPVVLPDIDSTDLQDLTDTLKPSKPTLRYTKSDSAPIGLARERVPRVDRDAKFSKFLDMMNTTQPSDEIWTSFFRPKTAGEILLDGRVVNQLNVWLRNSYKILKKRTKRHNFKRSKKSDDLDDFIVSGDEDGTDDDEFTPLAILVGSPGVGKSSAVYALVEESGGYVYEINASQARGRKDILNNVKELSTTQLVHQNQETVADNEFQKGVILFEDVDVLFESDKGFWSVMENTLSISRRPIILTCTDLSVIPQNILDCADKEGTVFDLKKQSHDELSDYLYLTGLTKGYDVEKPVLDKLISDNSCDLRSCLLNLQVLCSGTDDDGMLTRISSRVLRKRPKSVDDESGLSSFATHMELYSVADIVQTVTHSQIHHQPEENEITSYEHFLPHDELKSSALPFEFDLATGIINELPTYPLKISPPDDTNEIRRRDKTYICSRVRGKRLTRRAISNMAQIFESEHGDNTVFDIMGSHTYIMDIAPMIRDFARYDEMIIMGNEEMKQFEDEQEKELGTRLHRSIPVLTKFGQSPDTVLVGPSAYWKPREL